MEDTSAASSSDDNRDKDVDDFFPPPTTPYDVAVIGGGVVGLAVLRHATLMGYKACVVEREVHLAGWASGSNSGIACTGVDAPDGSLERALVREANSSIRAYCNAMGVPFRETGSLVCSWPWSQDKDLEKVLKQSHSAGDTHATLLGQDQVRAWEPALSECLGAVHIPGEIVLDPWLYTISLAVHARENGADIYTGFEVDVDQSFFSERLGLWTLVNKKYRLPRTHSEGDSESGPSPLPAPTIIRARSVVNASGAWADLVEEKMVRNCCWKSLPRRGQYLILPCSTVLTLTRPIQPVPTDRTKGIFVFPSLYGQIVVGPTATDQQSRSDREPSRSVREELLDAARKVVPSLVPGGSAGAGADLSESAILGEYVGIRPATDHRDYQIRLKVAQRWVACTGIRSTGTYVRRPTVGRRVSPLARFLYHLSILHCIFVSSAPLFVSFRLGLTASLAIGRHVVYLLEQGVLTGNNAAETNTSEPAVAPAVNTSPIPSVEDLISDFVLRGDGSVAINGHAYKVTHPLTVLGWKEVAKAESSIISFPC
jgi:glycerol-3-phosphate dehydrogenase